MRKQCLYSYAPVPRVRLQAAEVLLLEAEQRMGVLQQIMITEKGARSAAEERILGLQRAAAQEAQAREAAQAQVARLRAEAEALAAELERTRAAVLEEEGPECAASAGMGGGGLAAQGAGAASVKEGGAEGVGGPRGECLEDRDRGRRVPSLAKLAQSVHLPKGVLSRLLQRGSGSGGGSARAEEGREGSGAATPLLQRGDSGGEWGLRGSAGRGCKEDEGALEGWGGGSSGAEGEEGGEWVSMAALQWQLQGLRHVTEEVAAQHEAACEKVEALRCGCGEKGRGAGPVSGVDGLRGVGKRGWRGKLGLLTEDDDRRCPLGIVVESRRAVATHLKTTVHHRLCVCGMWDKLLKDVAEDP